MESELQQQKLNNKPKKWLSNKALELSFNQKQKSQAEYSSSRRPLYLNYTSSSTSPTSPSSPRNTPKPKPSHGMSKQDELKEVFRHFDGDGDGKISALELRAYFASVGEYMSYEDAFGIITDLDSDGDHLLDFHDFLRLMKIGGAADVEDLKQAFHMFELERGDGCITPRGLHKMLQKLGEDTSLEDCVSMIQVFDVDGDGVLDFHEFHRMMA